jgi:hypothetical protein
MEGMGVKRKLSQIPHFEWITISIKSWLFTWIWCHIYLSFSGGDGVEMKASTF